jgi:hypothetical protein
VAEFQETLCGGRWFLVAMTGKRRKKSWTSGSELLTGFLYRTTKREIKKKREERKREVKEKKSIRLKTRIPAEGLFGNSYTA